MKQFSATVDRAIKLGLKIVSSVAQPPNTKGRPASRAALRTFRDLTPGLSARRTGP